MAIWIEYRCDHCGHEAEDWATIVECRGDDIVQVAQTVAVGSPDHAASFGAPVADGACRYDRRGWFADPQTGETRWCHEPVVPTPPPLTLSARAVIFALAVLSIVAADLLLGNRYVGLLLRLPAAIVLSVVRDRLHRRSVLRMRRLLPGSPTGWLPAGQAEALDPLCCTACGERAMRSTDVFMGTVMMRQGVVIGSRCDA